MTTQISDSMSKALTALDTMDNHAARIREVAVRLLAEHADQLPELLAVRPMPGRREPQLELQPRTNQAAAQWAQALGIELEQSFVGDGDDWQRVHVSGHVFVDGVRVHVGACEWVASAEAAARADGQVAA